LRVDHRNGRAGHDSGQHHDQCRDDDWDYLYGHDDHYYNRHRDYDFGNWIYGNHDFGNWIYGNHVFRDGIFVDTVFWRRRGAGGSRFSSGYQFHSALFALSGQ
jgi:hypothetical protein